MAIVLFMPFQLFSQISREDAFNIVKTQVFANDFSDYEISALPNVLQPYTSIDLTSYNNGSYVVVLVCDGINSDSKIFVKQ